MLKILCCGLALLLTLACERNYDRFQDGDILIRASRGPGSSPAGNLVTSAIQKVHGLDIVLYPAALISDKMSLASPGMNDFDRSHLVNLFPQGAQDQMMIGTMSGSAIRHFIEDRSSDIYAVDLEVAGVKYDISYIGGYKMYEQFLRERDLPLEDDRRYRVAVSKFFFFSGSTFPGYKYRNGFNFSFKDTGKVISAREALDSYLRQVQVFPALNEMRARVRNTVVGDVGRQTISAIQGTGHRSPFWGKKATTRGIITAVGAAEFYPGGLDIYIENPNPDNDPLTSEGLHVYLNDRSQLFALGEEIEVSGTVVEQLSNTGLGRTSVRDVTAIKKIEYATEQARPKLPEPVQLMREGEPDTVSARQFSFTQKPTARSIPTREISTYWGNLNNKERLKLSDAMDFYESLEGMRVEFSNPRIVGFRGGQEDFENTKPKTYLNLYVVPNAERVHDNATSAKGAIIDEASDDYNPEILQITTNHLTHPFDTNRIFNIGDVLEGSITGVLGYERNLFGDAEFSIVMPEEQPAIMNFTKSAPPVMTNLPDRGITKLLPDADHLTIASANVENLSGHQKRRLEKLAESILVNLQCPDIVNLVEIQDFNGQDFSEGASAELTLKNLIALIQCPNTNYQPLNIDPVNNSEGGEPGGNIRVAMIYNANRVGFERRGNADSLEETIVQPDGTLRNNPGRVFPNNSVFAGTRRSIVAEFTFKGEHIFVIGNHFNSKLGDVSRWGAIQPANFDSDQQRELMADRINDFVELVSLRRPGAHIIVAGDFNALIKESSMNVLEGEHLKNLVSMENLVPKHERYTTNHNGNSQPLDYIFASHGLVARDAKVEILHMNSDFMGRLSDHDPLVARFRF